MKIYDFSEPLLERGTLGLWGPFGVRKREDIFFSNFLDKH
jgi:hypothetical protein